MQQLTTDRLALRPFSIKDVEAAFGFFGDPEVMHFSLNGPHASHKPTEDFIQANINRQARLGFSIWAVIERASSDLIGMCGLAEFGHGVPGIELAYRLRRDRWGRGYATEVGQAAVNHAFGSLGLDRLIAAVERENTPSIHVLEKCGFVFLEDRGNYPVQAKQAESMRDGGVPGLGRIASAPPVPTQSICQLDPRYAVAELGQAAHSDEYAAGLFHNRPDGKPQPVLAVDVCHDKVFGLFARWMRAVEAEMHNLGVGEETECGLYVIAAKWTQCETIGCQRLH